MPAAVVQTTGPGESSSLLCQCMGYGERRPNWKLVAFGLTTLADERQQRLIQGLSELRLRHGRTSGAVDLVRKCAGFYAPLRRRARWTNLTSFSTGDSSATGEVHDVVSRCDEFAPNQLERRRRFTRDGGILELAPFSPACASMGTDMAAQRAYPFRQVLLKPARFRNRRSASRRCRFHRWVPGVLLMLASVEVVGDRVG